MLSFVSSLVDINGLSLCCRDWPHETGPLTALPHSEKFQRSAGNKNMDPAFSNRKVPLLSSLADR